MMKEFHNNDILFIFPHQLKFFKKKSFDISLSIGNLCEMEKKQIKYYQKNIIIKITKYLLKLKNIKINILIGPGFEKHNKIFALNKKFEQIKLIRNVKNL